MAKTQTDQSMSPPPFWSGTLQTYLCKLFSFWCFSLTDRWMDGCHQMNFYAKLTTSASTTTTTTSLSAIEPRMFFLTWTSGGYFWVLNYFALLHHSFIRPPLIPNHPLHFLLRPRLPLRRPSHCCRSEPRQVFL